MKRTKPQDEKNKDMQKQQGGYDEEKRDKNSRQQQQDSTNPRQPGNDPDVLEENPELDVETGRGQPVKPSVEPKIR